MTRASKCSHVKSNVVVNRSVRTLLNNAIGSQAVDYFETPNNFCANAALQRHLAIRRYTVHPCAAVRETLLLAARCDIFSSTSPPPYEVQPFPLPDEHPSRNIKSNTSHAFLYIFFFRNSK